ncbi:MAG: histidine kinase [Chitinophagaceae bacterium]
MKKGLLLPTALFYLTTAFCQVAEHMPGPLLKVPCNLGRMLFDTYQDRQGYIWIASSSGVARYNGSRFTYYSKQDGLTDYDVFSFLEDRQDRIWAVTFNGEPCFFSEGKWHNPANTPWLKALSGNGTIQSIIEGPEQTVVLVSARKAFLINGSQTAVLATVDTIRPRFRQLAGAAVFQQQLVLLTDAGFYLPDQQRFVELPDTVRFLNQNIKTAVWNNLLCVSQNRHVYLFDRRLRLVKQLGNPGNELVLRIQNQSQETSRWEAGNENRLRQPLLICTEKSVYSLADTTPNGLRPIVTSLPWISSVQTDRAGNVWATSLTNGLYLAANSSFRKINVNAFSPEDICSRLQVINGQLWLGTEEGYVFAENVGNADSAVLPAFRLVHKTRFSESFKRIRTLRQDGDRLYIGMDGGMLVANLDNGRIITVNGATKALIALNDDSLLIARSGILIKMPRPLALASTQQPAEYPQRVLLREKVLCITQAGGDSAWLGCWKGIKLLVGGQLSAVPAAINSIQTPVTDIAVLPDGKLLIGTREEGLYLFNGTTLQALTSGNGQPPSINQLLYSGQQEGGWWIATSTGVLQLRQTKKDQYVLENPQIQIPNEGEVYSIALHNDLLWMATEKGVFTYPLARPQLPGPNVFWEEIQLRDSIIQINGRPHTPVLHFRQNNITLRFTSFFFSTVQTAQYRYRIREMDEPWTITHTPEINYQQLAPGKYSVEVQARYPESKFGEPTVFTFEIDQPWWNQWWFSVLLAFSLLMGIVFLFRKRMKRLQERSSAERKQMELEKEKLSLHHQLLQWQQEAEKAQLTPHFIFNAIYALQGYYGAGRTEDGKKYAEKFSSLIREQLRLSGKAWINLTEEIQLLRNFCEWRNMKKKNPVHINIQIQHTTDSNLLIPAMLLQPLVENCFDHGFENDEPGQRIEMTIHSYPDQQYVKVEIVDNGTGYRPFSSLTIEPSPLVNTENSNRKGILLIQQRLQLLAELNWGKNHGHAPLFEITDADLSGEYCGCKVVLKIPCSFERHDYV